MIDHTGVAVSDVAKSKAFYRAALAPLGYAIIMEFDDGVGLGVPPKPDFWIGRAAKTGARFMSRFAPIRARRSTPSQGRARRRRQGQRRAGLRPHYHANYTARSRSIRTGITSKRYVMPRRRLLRLLVALALFALSSLALAQAWPDKPIKFVVAAGPGSSLDTLARVIADKLKDRLGQSVIVENKPAAGGTVATSEVAKAAPDGYTMLLGFNGPLAFGPLLQKLPYDVQKDLAPVIITTSQPNVLVVNAELPVKTLQELVAYAKANPGKLAYASVGNGSSSHLNMELLKSGAGIDALHVPFNGRRPRSPRRYRTRRR
jgi:catechol 2,3-dioxygenase-like lactoylglutathione lyase family enzyme